MIDKLLNVSPHSTHAINGMRYVQRMPFVEGGGWIIDTYLNDALGPFRVDAGIWGKVPITIVSLHCSKEVCVAFKGNVADKFQTEDACWGAFALPHLKVVNETLCDYVETMVKHNS